MELFRSCGIIVPSSYFYNFYHKEYLIVPVEVYMVVINVILSFAVCLFVLSLGILLHGSCLPG